MQGRAERAVRGTLLGSASVLLAAAGHALAGGGVPGWLAVVTGLVAASVVGTVVIGRRPSLARTSVVVALGQAGFHYLFAGLGGPGIAAAPHVHGVLHLAGGASGAAAADHAAHLTSPGMLATHALAALVTLVLLRRAESAVWRMLRRVLHRVVAPATASAPAPLPRLPRPVSRPSVAPRSSAHPPRARRGPPALSVA